MIKIALIGPESTGKTELSRKLAEYFHTDWEPELAREYIENLDGKYLYDDVCEIARLQILQEMKYVDRKDDKSFVFFDTDLIITKVWLEYKYGKVPAFVNERISSRYFDLYLLCEPDLPWIADSVREHGDDRPYFFDWYLHEIEVLGIPFAKINGIGEERFQHALKAVNDFVLNNL